jgi:arabinofuranan 3-O-arabinosyltransferase
VALPAVLAYLPLLLTQQGQVGADTKTYLYLDPARLLGRAPYLWDEHIGAGTITHQNIGYLWPMGPWYWLFETLGFPDWVAQRLWLGTVLFAAALGVRYLLTTLGWRDGRRQGAVEYGVLVASLAYMLSPYVLDYAARISVILLPWAGLPWLVALTVRALRVGGWRYPAWFALVVLTVGGINATALIMVAPAVVLWFVHATWVERSVSVRDALGVLVRMGVLTLATSLWWMAGLWAQGRYGLPVLRYTETYEAVASSSSAPEVLRGLGYWFFYGRDKLGPWIEPSVEYTNRSWLLGLSYLLPILALTAAAAVRWRQRTYFLAVLGVGALLAVAGHPWDGASPLGALFTAFTRTDAGLALRSTPRAVPLVVLSMSVFLGAGVRALGVALRPRWQPAPVALAGLASLLVIANLPPLWNGTMIAENLKRPEQVPDYWVEAAAWLDGRDAEAGGWSTRVLEVPGSDFASYRWGNTVDPITPGLLDRPYLARELFQYGSPGTSGLLIALDRPFHEDTIDADAVVPVARLFGVGDIVHRGDLQYERFRTGRPVIVAQRLDDVPGLGEPVAFGPATPNVAGPEQPLLDEISLALDPDLPHPAPVTVYPVEDPLGLIRMRSADQPLVLDGGPDGVVDAAGVGLLQTDQALFYAASFADDPDGLDQLLADGADLLVTDTNRQQARRWGTIQQNTGYTERVGEEPQSYDPTDQRLELFDDPPDTAFTTTEQRGPVTVEATDYGNPVTYIPDDRPANAVDGNTDTAWRVGAFSDVTGEALTLTFDEPTTADRLTLVQPVKGIVNRYITEMDLVFDDGARVPVTLDERSHTLPGQTLTFDERTFSRVTLEIRDTDLGRQRRYDGASGVGLAEVSVGQDTLGSGPVLDEVVRPPTFLLDAAGSSSIDHQLGFLFTRLRANPKEKVRTDEEPWLARAFELPTERSFGFDVTARLSALIADEAVDALIGIPSADEGGITARSGGRLPGSLEHRASAALDGDASTFWMPPVETGVRYLEYTFPEARTFDTLDLTVVADGRHSVPTNAFIQVDGDTTQVREVLLGDIPDGEEENATVTRRVEFPELTGRTIRIAFDQTRDIETIDWHSGIDVPLPIGIAEVGIPDAVIDAPPDEVDTGCRDDLLSVDGEPVPLRIVAPTEQVLARAELTAEPCGPDQLLLAAGSHDLRSAPGSRTGIDIDAVALTSAAGGAALAPSDWGASATRVTPELVVTDDGPVSATVQVPALTDDAWLVLAQSHSPGWTARVEGGPDLGEPVLVDGFANGWRLDPDALGDGPVTVRLEWTPQTVIWWALAASALGVLACLAIVVAGPLRARRRRPDGAAQPVAEATADLLPRLEPPGSRPAVTTRRRAVGASVAVTAVSWLLLPPPGLLALVVGGLTYASLRWARGRRLPTVVAAATLAVTGAYYVVQQYRFRFPPDFAWPRQFEAVHALGLVVVLLLLVDAAIGSARTSRRARDALRSARGDTSDP